jgi:hypothetical protein
MKQELGFTIMEVLISLLLMSMIMTLMIHVYLRNKSQFIYVQQALEQSLDLRWVHNLLTNSIRQAGFTPCIGVSHLQTVDRRSQTALMPWVIRSQYIQLNHMSNQFTELKKIISPTQLQLKDSQFITKSKPLIIADCFHAEVFNIASIDYSNRQVVLASPLIFAYSPSAYVGEWIEEVWSVKINKQGKKALYYGNKDKEELSTLIQTLQTNVQTCRKKQVMQITLGLENGDSHPFNVWMRNL